MCWHGGAEGDSTPEGVTGGARSERAGRSYLTKVTPKILNQHTNESELRDTNTAHLL